MLKGKRAIVTGAASGIGLAISQLLVNKEAQVVMADVNEAALKEKAQELGGFYYAGDLSVRETNKALVDYALEKMGDVDVLVNVAGIQTVSPIADFPEDRWDFMIRLMLTSPFLLMKYVWPSMKKNQWGRIINLNSIHGLVASEFKSAYISAKHGLTGLTRVAALEGAPDGITVNSICPAYVRTPLVDKQIHDQSVHHGIPEDEVVTKIMLQKAAIKKLLTPENVAELVEFLCSDTAAMMTGTTLTIDGGWTAA